MMDVIVGPHSRKSATDITIRTGFDELNSETARAVLARPDLYSLDVQRSACAWLMQNGDWMDYERARHLLAAIMRDGEEVEQARFEAKIWRLVQWFLGVILAVALAFAVGMAAEKAMRQYAHDAAMAAEWAAP